MPGSGGLNAGLAFRFGGPGVGQTDVTSVTRCTTVGHMRDVEMDGPVRAPGDAETRDRVLHIRVTETGLRALDQQAAREHRTRSDMVRVLLRRGLEASR